MMAKPTILKLFRSFCYRNKPNNLEQAIEYFSIFGGMGWSVDFSKSLDELIEEKILNNYRYIHGDLAKITQSNPTHHKVLTALALGDGKEFSAFKRARVEREEGEDSIDFLVDKEILYIEESVEKPLKDYEKVPDKARFYEPFMRFWFAFVSPNYKSIKDGDYREFKERWSNSKAEFSNLIYLHLFQEFVKSSYNQDSSDPIVKMGSYWDTQVDIELLAKCKSGKFIAGGAKIAKSKANKSELSKIEQKCQTADITPEMVVLFSKNKFSTELKKLKGEGVALFSLKSLNGLLFDLSEKDLLTHTNKRY